MTNAEFQEELNRRINRILSSNAVKKIIVSGPGTGKSRLFKTAIARYGGSRGDYLALTFINSLEDELKKDIGNNAKVYTFHGYCHYLLRHYPSLRVGLPSDFHYYPALIKLIKSDWEIIHSSESPQFTKLMRRLSPEPSVQFVTDSENRYGAVGYDDSVYRVYQALRAGVVVREKYKLIMVDEYQDFNPLETEVVKCLANFGPILVVGDDDQALYVYLRDSDPDLLRKLFNGNEFERFTLPFCLRCPEPVINAFHQIVKTARSKGILGRRIDKEFLFFPPTKSADSQKYPHILLVRVSAQRSKPLSANYLGRYVLKEIKKIPRSEIEESHDSGFVTTLVIGPNFYLKGIASYLTSAGYTIDMRAGSQELEPQMNDGLKLLKDNPRSSLGWRIILETAESRPSWYGELVSRTIREDTSLYDGLPSEFKEEIQSKVDGFTDSVEEIADMTMVPNRHVPTIKLATYEGSKGLSAQHVFIVGLQNGTLPLKPGAIHDLEVCKLLVAITRARKQCQLITTTRFEGRPTPSSEFINWLNNSVLKVVEVDKAFWGNNS
jgi:superfamily I DNA/RNA helicase